MPAVAAARDGGHSTDVLQQGAKTTRRSKSTSVLLLPLSVLGRVFPLQVNLSEKS